MPSDSQTDVQHALNLSDCQSNILHVQAPSDSQCVTRHTMVKSDYLYCGIGFESAGQVLALFSMCCGYVDQLTR